MSSAPDSTGQRLRIIGFAGPQDSGKDTAADALVEAFGWVKINPGDPIVDMVRSILRSGFVSEARIEHLVSSRSGRAKRIGGPFGDKSARDLMRSLGDDWGRGMVNPDLYTRIMTGRIARLILDDGAPGVAVTGIRKPNEAHAIRSAGGEVWRIHRPGFEETGVHTSETGFDQLPIDLQLDNDGDAARLQALVRDVFTQRLPSRRTDLTGGAS